VVFLDLLLLKILLGLHLHLGDAVVLLLELLRLLIEGVHHSELLLFVLGQQLRDVVSLLSLHLVDLFALLQPEVFDHSLVLLLEHFQTLVDLQHGLAVISVFLDEHHLLLSEVLDQAAVHSGLLRVQLCLVSQAHASKLQLEVDQVAELVLFADVQSVLVFRGFTLVEDASEAALHLLVGVQLKNGVVHQGRGTLGEIAEARPDRLFLLHFQEAVLVYLGLEHKEGVLSRVKDHEVNEVLDLRHLEPQPPVLI